MKKLLKVTLFLIVLGLICTPLFALVTTDNVDKDKFQYVVGYQFATSDLAVSQTLIDFPTSPGATSQVIYYTIPRGSTGNGELPSRLVGMSVAGSKALTGGAATFDVTINGTITGVQTVLQVGNTRTAVGNSGSGGTTYSYMNQDRSETAASLGFKAIGGTSAYFHNADNPYGRATPMVAGDRLGVKVTTSSAFASTTTDYVIVVYVLE